MLPLCCAAPLSHIFHSRLRENIVGKVVDRTDEFIAKAVHEEEIKQLQKELAETERRQKIVENLLKFHRDDQSIKTSRRSQVEVDKVTEREKNVAYFNDFLKIVADRKDKKDRQTKLFRNFWDFQDNEFRQKQKDEKKFDKDLLDLDNLKEMATEDDLVSSLYKIAFVIELLSPFPAS